MITEAQDMKLSADGWFQVVLCLRLTGCAVLYVKTVYTDMYPLRHQSLQVKFSFFCTFSTVYKHG